MCFHSFFYCFTGHALSSLFCFVLSRLAFQWDKGNWDNVRVFDNFITSINGIHSSLFAMQWKAILFPFCLWSLTNRFRNSKTRTRMRRVKKKREEKMKTECKSLIHTWQTGPAIKYLIEILFESARELATTIDVS